MKPESDAASVRATITFPPELYYYYVKCYGLRDILASAPQ